MNWRNADNYFPVNRIVLGSYRDGIGDYHVMECMHDGKQWCDTSDMMCLRPTKYPITHWSFRPDMPNDYKTNERLREEMFIHINAAEMTSGYDGQACNRALSLYFREIEESIVFNVQSDKTVDETTKIALSLSPFSDDDFTAVIKKSVDFLYGLRTLAE